MSSNQKQMMKILSERNCLQLSNPDAKITEKTLENKKSTVNLMFLEDVLEDIETSAKKMQQDINVNLRNIKSFNYGNKKVNQIEEVQEEDSDDDDYSDDADELDSNDFEIGDENKSESNRSVSDEEDSPRGLSLDEIRKASPARRKSLMKQDSFMSSTSNRSDNEPVHAGMSPFKAHSFFVKKKKRACNKSVRLALLEEGPFRQLMKEGVRVIVHFLRPGETRVTRVQRIMIWLDDDEVEQDAGETTVQDRELFDADSSEEEVDFDDDGEDKLNLFGFFKLDQNGVLESSTSLSDINEITTVYMGANTTVFRKSLDHLHGPKKSYDRSEHSNRCFSLIGCKSPFDDRNCLDIEILPRDKQKPEVNYIQFDRTYSSYTGNI